MFIRNLYKLFLVALMLPYQALSQADSSVSCASCCCSIDPTPAGVMISHVHAKRQWMVSYRYMNMSMGDMQVGTSKVSDLYVFNSYVMSSKKMSMNMHMLMGMYGLTNRLTLMGMVNLNDIRMEMSMLPGSTHVHNGVPSNELDHAMKTFGLGDVKIQALYSVLDNMHHHILLNAGISLPTGTIYLKGGSTSMYANQRYPYAMQMGSGSVEVLPGITYLFRTGRFTWSSQVSGIIRTGDNAIGYRWSNEYSMNHWASFRWARNFSSSIRAEAITSSYIRGNDPTLYAGNEPSASAYNYGGDKLTSFVGTNFHFRKGSLNGTKIGVEYGIPLYQNLYGPQMGNKSTLNALVSFTF